MTMIMVVVVVVVLVVEFGGGAILTTVIVGFNSTFCLYTYLLNKEANHIASNHKQRTKINLYTQINASATITTATATATATATEGVKNNNLFKQYTTLSILIKCWHRLKCYPFVLQSMSLAMEEFSLSHRVNTPVSPIFNSHFH
jgi:hypothetical protein